jgi:hypothetical protein
VPTDDRITWYVVSSKPRRETNAAANLRRLGYAVFLPRHWETWSRNGRVTTALFPFFPSYLFAAVDAGQGQSVYAINTAEDEHGSVLQRVVRFGGTLATIHPADLWALRRHFDPSGVLPPDPRSFKQLRRIVRLNMPGVSVDTIERIDDRGRIRLQVASTREMVPAQRAHTWSNR